MKITVRVRNLDFGLGVSHGYVLGLRHVSGLAPSHSHSLGHTHGYGYGLGVGKMKTSVR